MRLQCLDLRAYGHFHQTYFDLKPSADNTDLHIFYGQNEAGKTTILQAIKDVLFGFRHASQFNYCFPTNVLRVGTTIECRNKTLTFYRRINRTRSVVDKDDALIPDGASLVEEMVGIDRITFGRLFGLTQETLRRGGDDILSAKDDAGSVLFGATHGITALGAYADDLEARATEIFSPRATIRPLNKAISDYVSSRESNNRNQHTLAEWQGIKDQEAIELTNRNRISEDIARLRDQIARLKQRERLHLKICKIDGKREDLQRMKQVPSLDKEFVSSWGEAHHNVVLIEQRLEIISNNKQYLKDKSLSIYPVKLISPARLQSLEELVAEATVSRVDLTHLEAEQRDTHQKNAAIRQHFRDTLSITIPEKMILPDKRHLEEWQNMAVTYSENRGRARFYQGQLANLDSELKSSTQSQIDIKLIKNPTAISAALDQAHALTGAMECIKNHHNHRQRLLMYRDKALRVMGCQDQDQGQGQDQNESWQAIAVPQFTAVEGHVLQQHGLLRSQEVANARHQICRHRLNLIEGARIAFVPFDTSSEYDKLMSARALRDAAFDHIQEASAVNNVPEDRTLMSWNKATRLVDDQSDAMISKLRGLAPVIAEDHSINQLKEDLIKLEQDQGRLKKSLNDWKSRWIALWQGWTPPEPDMVRQWFDNHAFACALGNEIQQHASHIMDHEKLTTENETVLHSLLSHEPLAEKTLPSVRGLSGFSKRHAALKALASDLWTDHITAERHQPHLWTARKRTEEQHATISAEYLPIQKQHVELLARWKNMIQAHPWLDSGCMEQLQDITFNLFKLHDNRNDERRLNKALTLKRDVLGRLQNKVAKQSDVSTKEKDIDGILELSRDIIKKQHAAHDAKRLRDDLKLQINQASINEKNERGHLQDAKTNRRPYLVQARARTPKHVESQIACSQKRDALARDIATLESDIHAEGITEQDIARVSVTKPNETIHDQLKELAKELMDCEAQRDTTLRRQEQIKIKRLEIEDLTRPIHQDQELQNHCTTIIEEAERYIRYKTAASTLRWVMNHHVRKSHAPLLKDASRILARLTNNRYRRIVVESPKQGVLQLWVTGADDKPISVDVLSEGTRDQMYLALRLAAISHPGSIQAAHLPVIGDDILVHFDDQREGAALNLLHEMSQTRQVLLFTHHKHLISTAERQLGKNGFRLHHIPPPHLSAPSSLR